MRNEKEFNDIFERCLERISSGEATVEKCLSEYPLLLKELRPALYTALAVRKAARLEPSPAVTASIREKVFANIRPAEKYKAGFSWKQRLAYSMSVILVVVFGGSGTLVAAASSMPDSPLYPIKLATEQVQLKLTASPMERAELYVKQADRRITEIAYLVQAEKTGKVEQLTQKLDTAVSNVAQIAVTASGNFLTAAASDRNGQGLMGAASGASQPAPAVTAEPNLSSYDTPVVPPQAAPPATSAPAKTLSPAVPVPATTLPPAPNSANKPPATTRQTEKSETNTAVTTAENNKAVTSNKKAAGTEAEQTELKQLIDKYAIKHPAALRALLEKASPETRQAIIKAIIASQNNYQDALKAIENSQK